MIELKTADKNDIDYIFKLEDNNFSSEKYSIGAISDFVNNNTNLDVVRVLLKEDKIIAYIIYRINTGEAELFKICVDEFYRRKGYGTILMDDFINFARQNNVVNINLEVRSDNLPAIDFYKQYGFIEISLRKDYYKEPQADAIVMQLLL